MRYRGSVLGILWSLVNPIFMLGVYTFLFSGIFQMRRGAAVSSHSEYAITLFVGMIIHTFASECINRAPQLIVSNANYVKKVVFPLEALSIVTLMSALFNFLVSFAVLIVFKLVLSQDLPVTTPLAPLIILPLCLNLVALVLALSSLGVYIRDIAQMTGMVTTLLMFLSPVFYSLDALPPNLRLIALLNPLTIIIESMRDVLIRGVVPDLQYLIVYTLLSILFLALGAWFFSKVRRGFSDVL